jgi:transposase InsO family protein
MPQRLRVDNGPPWGSGSDLPRELALWLVGLGIDVIWNHPYRPQENGVVERAHGTTNNWVEPSTCANLTELQRRLDRAADLQRSRYPYRQGRSREQYYDTLSRGGVPYRPERVTREFKTWLSKALRE